ncbi:hypothetical protein GLAREA_00366 [Glarea lozoyensis ATCC 20868]|uniref:2EXR domain-containing protein n=1 Tax=Glarea lozoyensis (strain ATCC 20868 / MF5171) TaxID=1116229 RepID=S3DB62_GLAL2|nr:uncharacterized protein GLAREA_00366 [Glarea lozoyensis ATCC 20868]EPE29206.1 hypothetical protein GLAREA_00366 [Glarea lozoyensis ATCC 20868]
MSLSISHGLRKPTNFNSLPAELKNQIFNSLLAPRVVKIFWSYFTKTFYTNARFPSALHLCHDSRSLALAHYTLSFGLTPEKSRIYFSYTHDTADFQWTYLANYSGLGVHYEVLRTKLGAQDYAGLSRITMKERELTGRATDSFVDLRGFRNLSDVFVICDRSAAQVDKNWSVVILQDLWRGLEDDVERWGRGPGRWPRLWCDKVGNTSIRMFACYEDR